MGVGLGEQGFLALAPAPTPGPFPAGCRPPPTAALPPPRTAAPLYASCATLRGALPCPRDDVEGLLYSLLAMGAPPDPSGRPIRNRLPFTVGVCARGISCTHQSPAGGCHARKNARRLVETLAHTPQVVMGSEAEGGPWSQRIMKVWADRKEAGWREAVAKVRGWGLNFPAGGPHCGVAARRRCAMHYAPTTCRLRPPLPARRRASSPWSWTAVTRWLVVWDVALPQNHVV
jgi:hypothetical protein